MRIVSVRGGRIDLVWTWRDAVTHCEVVEVDRRRPGRELLRLSRGRGRGCGNRRRSHQHRRVNPESSFHVSSSFVLIAARVATFAEARSRVNPACLSPMTHASPEGTNWWARAWVATPACQNSSPRPFRVVHFSASGVSSCLHPPRRRGLSASEPSRRIFHRVNCANTACASNCKISPFKFSSCCLIAPEKY